MNSLKLIGTYVKGIGEGAYYISLPYYKHAFEAILGCEPYPGTFNVKVSRCEAESARELAREAGVRVDGCGELGGVWVYPCAVESRLAWAVFPDESKHEDHIELVAPYRISEALGVIPGDRVKVELWGPEVWPIAVSIWRRSKRP